VASVLVLGIAAWYGSREAPRAALGALVASILVGAVLGFWVARRGVLDFPLGRARGINLRATRGVAPPPVWLMAHLDSKSQPIPTAARAAGIVATIAVWIVALGAAIAGTLGAEVSEWWTWIFVAALVAGTPVAASIVGPHSPGALDDASGVATVLEAVARLEPASPVGVILTSAEELGLAGARAVARRHPPSMALNCDGVDDRGTLVCMRGSRGGERSAAALEAAARKAGVALIIRGLIPGLLVDSVALSDAGWDAVTLSRGSWSTLARIHRPHDDLDHLSGAGVEEAAAVLADAVRQLQSNSSP
jgi:hypothetical protein